MVQRNRIHDYLFFNNNSFLIILANLADRLTPYYKILKNIKDISTVLKLNIIFIEAD